MRFAVGTARAYRYPYHMLSCVPSFPPSWSPSWSPAPAPSPFIKQIKYQIKSTQKRKPHLGNNLNRLTFQEPSTSVKQQFPTPDSFIESRNEQRPTERTTLWRSPTLPSPTPLGPGEGIPTTRSGFLSPASSQPDTLTPRPLRTSSACAPHPAAPHPQASGVQAPMPTPGIEDAAAAAWQAFTITAAHKRRSSAGPGPQPKKRNEWRKHAREAGEKKRVLDARKRISFPANLHEPNF